MSATGAAMSKRPMLILKAAVIYFLCLIVTAVTILPFLWMLSTSFKIPTEAMNMPPQWIPNPAILDNYRDLFTNPRIPFLAFGQNSAKIAVLVVLGRLFICSLAGYGFSRLNFHGKNIAFTMLIGSMMVPNMVTVFPLYVWYKNWPTWLFGPWIDTHWPLIVPPIIANTFGTFLMRQFLMTIPRELEEAAVVDGASHFRVFWTIMMPLSKPILATLAIFTFMNTWNEFFHALIFLNRTENFTVSMGLAYFNGEAGTQYTKLMAGVMLSIIPILAIYTFAQQYFTTGITLSGIKG